MVVQPESVEDATATGLREKEESLISSNNSKPVTGDSCDGGLTSTKQASVENAKKTTGLRKKVQSLISSGKSRPLMGGSCDGGLTSTEQPSVENATTAEEQPSVENATTAELREKEESSISSDNAKHVTGDSCDGALTSTKQATKSVGFNRDQPKSPSSAVDFVRDFVKVCGPKNILQFMGDHLNDPAAILYSLRSLRALMNVGDVRFTNGNKGKLQPEDLTSAKRELVKDFTHEGGIDLLFRIFEVHALGEGVAVVRDVRDDDDDHSTDGSGSDASCSGTSSAAVSMLTFGTQAHIMSTWTLLKNLLAGETSSTSARGRKVAFGKNRASKGLAELDLVDRLDVLLNHRSPAGPAVDAFDETDFLVYHDVDEETDYGDYSNDPLDDVGGFIMSGCPLSGFEMNAASATMTAMTTATVFGLASGDKANLSAATRDKGIGLLRDVTRWTVATQVMDMMANDILPYVETESDAFAALKSVCRVTPGVLEVMEGTDGVHDGEDYHKRAEMILKLVTCLVSATGVDGVNKRIVKGGCTTAIEVVGVTVEVMRHFPDHPAITVGCCVLLQEIWPKLQHRVQKGKVGGTRALRDGVIEVLMRAESSATLDQDIIDVAKNIRVGEMDGTPVNIALNFFHAKNVLDKWFCARPTVRESFYTKKA